MNWALLIFNEASGDVLVMWNRRVVGKLEVFIESSQSRVALETWKIASLGLLQ